MIEQALARYVADAPPKKGNVLSWAILLNEDGNILASVKDYARILQGLAGRTLVRNEYSRYESAALALLRVNAAGGKWPLHEDFPGAPSPLALDAFFAALYRVYDLRFAYTYTDPGVRHLARVLWHPDSAAIAALHSRKFAPDFADYSVRISGTWMPIIKNDMEFILMQRKPGGYRQPTITQRDESRLGKDDFSRWFQQIWNITGASTKHHPAPFPLELANRLVRMFSFSGDTVFDPFCGSGTTMVAALRTGRNSIGVDIDPEYCRMAARYLKAENADLFATSKLLFEKVTKEPASLVKNRRHMRRLGTDTEGKRAYGQWDGLVSKNPFTADKDIVDNQVAIIEYENGVRATFHTNCNSGIPERRMYINGSEGAIRADLVDGYIKVARIGFNEKLRKVKASTKGSHGGGDDVLARELCGSMLTGRVPEVGLDEGLTSAFTCFGIDEAMNKGAVVEMDKYWRLLP